MRFQGEDQEWLEFERNSYFYLYCHTSVRKSGSPRTITPPAAKSSAPYKAVVYINLAGGVDSFNILTPGPSNCALYNEYMDARGKGSSNIGLKAEEILPIDGSSARLSQCSTLGVNKLLSAYKDIFDEGSGVFFANMGCVSIILFISFYAVRTRHCISPCDLVFHI